MTPPLADVVCRLALFLHCNNDYQELLRKDCLEAAARHDFSVRVFLAENDARTQLEQIRACLREPLARRPTALLVHPVSETRLDSAAYMAARAGVGWVLLGRRSEYMPDLRKQFPQLPIFSVTPDQRLVGRTQGLQLRMLLPKGGEVLHIRGPHGISSASQRTAGLEEVLRGTAIKIRPALGDWTEESGVRAMTDWLQTFGARKVPKFLVGAQNDAMAMGARSALAHASRLGLGFSVNDISFIGCDGTAQYGRRLVTEGKLRATVVMPSTTGPAVAELAILYENRSRPQAQIVLTPMSCPSLEALEIAGRTHVY
jgi:ABC-type sugar transport system substrate-binding protein